jgi:hypothetical protein
MSIVDKAPPAAPLVLTDSSPAIFTQRDETSVPTVVTVPGSSNMALMLFDVLATGTAKASVPGTVVLTLYGRANLKNPSLKPSAWLPLASTPAEPIGGETDLPEAMFMLCGCDLMANPETGKIQGTFKCNVASNPQEPIDLTEHPGDVTEEDPLYVFAIGASFTPGAPLEAKRATPKAEPEPLVTLTLANLTLNA